MKHQVLLGAVFSITAPLSGVWSVNAQAQRGATDRPAPPLQTDAPAGKPVLDAAAIQLWPSAESLALSNDGQYLLHILRYGHWLTKSPASKLVIRSTRTNWKREIWSAAAGRLTRNSQLAVYLTANDSLCLLTLGASSVECLPHVSTFQLLPHGTEEWLLYRRNAPTRELVARHLGTGREQVFASVTDYAAGPDGTTLVLQTESQQGGAATRAVHWVRLAGGGTTIIWTAGSGAPQQASSFVFDSSGGQLAFLVKDRREGLASPAVWYYRADTEEAILVADSRSAGIGNDLQIDAGGNWRFSRDGRSLFFLLKETVLPSPKPDAVMVDVWSYTDAKLQSQQLKELALRSYTAVLHLADRRIVRLQHEEENLLLLGAARGDVAIITDAKADYVERNWNLAAQESSYLVSVATGERKRFIDGSVAPVQSRGNYVVVREPAGRNYFSYDTRTGRVTNLTAALPIPVVNPEYDEPESQQDRGLEVAAWVENETAVLIYDRFDIWEVDPAGNRPPVNLTNGYGRRHSIVFRLAAAPGEYQRKTLVREPTLMLTAFDRTTKHSGFYRVMPGRSGDPERLSMGPYTYEIFSAAPLKIRGAEAYLVRRGSAVESPNYFTTSDLKTFAPLTSVYPESAYNWLRSELLTWQTLDGRAAQGVLFKPENFDPAKKYPVILNYYEKKSDRTYQYHRPEFMSHDINIPWFVSRGYLVFTPDIYYTIGSPGQGAYNAVVSAAQHLAKLPWVDVSRIGIQGHSWGGFETNYLVTHTTMFAAAMSSSGPSDFVSGYGGVLPESGTSGQFFYERQQMRIGAALWERPDLYVENSPVFRADRVTTPLLMMNNKDDGVVAFAQGVEFFTALRRLGKRVWMLQYDGEAHLLVGAKAAEQHTIRVTQFFDHYLKDAPAPKWMTQGVPARLKGIETGLELDSTGKTPGPGLLMEAKRLTAQEPIPPRDSLQIPLEWTTTNGVLCDGNTRSTVWPKKQPLPFWMYQEVHRQYQSPGVSQRSETHSQRRCAS